LDFGVQKWIINKNSLGRQTSLILIKLGKIE